MSSLEHYQRIWKLSNASLIASTVNGEVYKVNHQDGIAALKLLSPLGEKDEAGGAIALQYFAGRGAVRLLEKDDHAQLMHYADGRFLKELKDAAATEIACEVIALLHGRQEPLPVSLPSMQANFRALLAHEGCSMLAEGARLARQLLASEREIVVLHGDLHHKNILACSTNGWLAIDPKGLIGERSYDFANLFYNPDDHPELLESLPRIQELAGKFSRFFQIEQKRILEFAFAYGCLSSAWALEDGQDPSRRLRIDALIKV